MSSPGFLPHEIDLNSVSIPLRQEEVFSRQAPLYVEIGSGKGRFSVEFALAHGEINYLSVERAPKYHGILLERAARRGAENIRLLHTTAEDLIFRLLPRESVDVFFILFPDPWPKKRHHKRRLICPPVIEGLHRALKPGGRLLIKSDHPEYTQRISEVLAGAQGFEPIDASAFFSDLPLTGFEIKYQQEGRTITPFGLEKTRKDG